MTNKSRSPLLLPLFRYSESYLGSRNSEIAGIAAPDTDFGRLI